jgi:hypothetical protein
MSREPPPQSGAAPVRLASPMARHPGRRRAGGCVVGRTARPPVARCPPSAAGRARWSPPVGAARPPGHPPLEDGVAPPPPRTRRIPWLPGDGRDPPGPQRAALGPAPAGRRWARLPRQGPRPSRTLHLPVCPLAPSRSTEVQHAPPAERAAARPPMVAPWHDRAVAPHRSHGPPSREREVARRAPHRRRRGASAGSVAADGSTRPSPGDPRAEGADSPPAATSGHRQRRSGHSREAPQGGVAWAPPALGPRRAGRCHDAPARVRHRPVRARPVGLLPAQREARPRAPPLLDADLRRHPGAPRARAPPLLGVVPRPETRRWLIGAQGEQTR